MTRRTLGLLVLLALGVVCAPLAVAAPSAEWGFRIGFLASGPPPPDSVPPAFPLTAFRQGLRELGYVEGHTVILEERWAAGELALLPALAAELVQLPVDVIVASGASAVRAATGATRSIPIVIAGAADPVAEGLVASLGIQAAWCGRGEGVRPPPIPIRRHLSPPEMTLLLLCYGCDGAYSR